jgi:hypothetical protein
MPRDDHKGMLCLLWKRENYILIPLQSYCFVPTKYRRFRRINCQTTKSCVARLVNNGGLLSKLENGQITLVFRRNEL